MTVNVELLQKTLETIKANPDHWKQQQWHCGTSHCFAGFAELLYFGLPVNSYDRNLRKDNRIYSPQDDSIESYWITCDNATKALDLQEDDAMQLFDGGNTLEMLESMVKHLVEQGTLIDYIYPVYEGDDDD